MQAGPSSTRSVRLATAASSVNASSRRLTNSASPHQTESISGAASTASAKASRSRGRHSPTRTPRLESVIPKFMVVFRSRALDHGHEVALYEHARFHRHLHDLAGRTRRRIRKHLHPFIVDRFAHKLLHPYRHLDDVFDRRAGGLDHVPHVLEHERALLLQRGGKLRGGGIGAADEARDDDVADPTRVRDRRLVGNLADIDAGARHRWLSDLFSIASSLGRRNGVLARRRHARSHLWTRTPTVTKGVSLDQAKGLGHTVIRVAHRPSTGDCDEPPG